MTWCAWILLFPSLGLSAEKQVMWGIYDTTEKDAFSKAKSFEAATGLNTSIVAWHSDFSDRFPMEGCAQVWASHRLPLIKWDLKTSGTAARPISLRAIIDGDLDPYLQTWADDAAHFEQPVLIEVLRQFNRANVPWSAVSQRQENARVADAFRKITDVFRQRGAHNVRWIWCAHVFPDPPIGSNNWEDAYPGNSSVDMVALEAFDLSRTPAFDLPLTFEQMFHAPLRRLEELASRKPVLLTDIPLGFANDPSRNSWLQSLALQVSEPSSRVQAVLFSLQGDRNIQPQEARILQKLSRDARAPLTIAELIRRPFFWAFFWFGSDKAPAALLPTWNASFIPSDSMEDLPTSLAAAPSLHMNFSSVSMIGNDLTSDAAFSGQAKLGWNPRYLFFWCEVKDSTVGESHAEPSKIAEGDHLELDVGATKRPETISLSDCVRLQISPGSASHMQPAYAWIETSTGAMKPRVEGVMIHSQFGVDGQSYRLFGAIPWKALGFTPHALDRIRLNLSLIDSNGRRRVRELVWSGGAHAFHDPAEWGYVELQRPSPSQGH